jgi:hypothetical protein
MTSFPTFEATSPPDPFQGTPESWRKTLLIEREALLHATRLKDAYRSRLMALRAMVRAGATIDALRPEIEGPVVPAELPEKENRP